MTGPKIRTAVRGDLSGVLALWRTEGVEPSRTDDAAALRGLLRHPTSTLLIAEDDGAVVGSIIAAWDGWRGELYRLAVAEGHRRHGLATELLRRAEAWLVDQGARRINALVLHDDGRARSFWTSVGYEVDGRLGRYVRDAGPR
jgi:ribosomal protein S18 acetylase RimI-like enzyme